MRFTERLMRPSPTAAPLVPHLDVAATVPVAMPGLRLQSLIAIGAGSIPRTVMQLRPSLRLLSFIAVVLLPTAFAAIYYFLVAADQYVTEFRFTLSTADAPRLDPLTLFVGAAVQSPAALESQVLVQYVASRAIVDAIGATLDLRQLFSPPQADWWSRLSQGSPIEELVRYWKAQVDPFYDPADSTVTVRVRAFTPSDALRLAQAVVAASETLANRLSMQARQDALRQSEGELSSSESRLKTTLGKMRALRDREGLIDPTQAVASTDALSTRLRDQLVQANTELATLRSYMRDDAPSVKVLKARIRSLETQRRSLAHELTDNGSPHTEALSGVLSSYEELASEQKFAETAYQLALHRVDEARANADRQRVFIASFVPPSLPEESLYPRRWQALGTIALVMLAVWAIGGLAMQSVRDHLT
jgi:capsular polysaccharide transport system permease protein